MTYCVGVLLNDGVVLASDSRTNAGVDNFATFCKMTVFERPDDRLIVLLSSGNLAGTQAVISLLKQRGIAEEDGIASIWNARTMFDVALLLFFRRAKPNTESPSSIESSLLRPASAMPSSACWSHSTPPCAAIFRSACPSTSCFTNETV